MQEELRLQENKRILTELENKLNSYLSTGSTLAPPQHTSGASAEKLVRDLHGPSHHRRPQTQHAHQTPATVRLSQYAQDCSWVGAREGSHDKHRSVYLPHHDPPPLSVGVDPSRHDRKEYNGYKEQQGEWKEQTVHREQPVPTSFSTKRIPDPSTHAHSYLSTVKNYHAADQYRTAPSVDHPHSLKLSTAVTKSTRESMIGPGMHQHPTSSVLFSLKTPTAVRQEAAPSYTSLNTKLYPMGPTIPTTTHLQNTLQPAYTRSVLRPAVSTNSQNTSSLSHYRHSLNTSNHSGKDLHTSNSLNHSTNSTNNSQQHQKHDSFAPQHKDTDNSSKTAHKPSPADDYNRRKSELDALVQRFEARKKSEVVAVVPERSVSHARNVGSSVSRGVSTVGVPVPRINLQESLTEVSHGRSRLERQASTVTEARRVDVDRSVDDRNTGEPSKSSCRTIALHSEIGKTIRGSAERIPITRERSRTIERYLRRKSSTYQLDERSVELAAKPEPANRKLSVDVDTTLRCRCLNTDSRGHAQNKTMAPRGSKESDSGIEQSKVDIYPPRRQRSEAQDREYREIFNIKAYEEKENQPAYNRSLSRQVIEQKENQPSYNRNLSRQLLESKEAEKPSQQRLNRTMSTFTNQTFEGLEGSENSTYTRYVTDDRLGLAQQKTNSSSQLLRDEQFLESLANLLVDKIGLKVQQQTATRKPPAAEAYKPTRDLPARRELLSTSKFR